MFGRMTWIVGLTSLACWFQVGCTASRASFGEPLKISPSDTIAANTLLADPSRYDGQVVRVSGKVDSVCAMKGCWIRLAGGNADETIFVKFTCPVDGRLVPMDAVGHQATVEGTLEVTEISEDEARHYKEDAGASAAEIAAVVGPQRQLRMQSPGAEIAGITK